MRLMEVIVVVLAMLVPFIAIKSKDFATYLYWIGVTSVYLVYISLRRWEEFE